MKFSPASAALSSTRKATDSSAVHPNTFPPRQSGATRKAVFPNALSSIFYSHDPSLCCETPFRAACSQGCDSRYRSLVFMKIVLHDTFLSRQSNAEFYKPRESGRPRPEIAPVQSLTQLDPPPRQA